MVANGRIDTDIGTIRGVAFNGLHGSMRIMPGEAQLSGGTVELGNSVFAHKGGLHASAVAFVTGHEHPDKAQSMLDWQALARFPGTLVFYMGLARVEETCLALVAGGRAGATPAALVSRATLPDARVIVGTLADIAERVREAQVEAPALLVVGEVVGRRVGSVVATGSVARAASG